MLIEGSWLPENRAALEALIREFGAGGAHYNSASPPFAVFDWDQTVIRHDIGDALFLHQIEHLGVAHSHDEFWTVLDYSDSAGLRKAIELLRALTPAQRAERAEQEVWREAMLLGFVRAGELDPQHGFPWQTRLLTGLTVDEVRQLVSAVIEAELALPLADREYTLDGRRLGFHQGIRPYPEILDLIRALEEAGIAAWIVSATNVWAVQVMAEHLGLSGDRVIGMRTRVVGGRITAELEGPVPATAGKVEAIRYFIHPTQRPVLVAGDNITDLPMLDYSAHTRLVIDRGVAALREVAQQRRAAGEVWLIQPQFTIK